MRVGFLLCQVLRSSGEKVFRVIFVKLSCAGWVQTWEGSSGNVHVSVFLICMWARAGEGDGHCVGPFPRKQDGSRHGGGGSHQRFSGHAQRSQTPLRHESGRAPAALWEGMLDLAEGSLPPP